MMVKCDPRHGKYMACCMMYRGCSAENYRRENVPFVLRKFTAGEISYDSSSSVGFCHAGASFIACISDCR